MRKTRSIDTEEKAYKKKREEEIDAIVQLRFRFREKYRNLKIDFGIDPVCLPSREFYLIERVV